MGVGPVVESPVQENPVEELLQDDTPGSGGTPTVGGAPSEGQLTKRRLIKRSPQKKFLRAIRLVQGKCLQQTGLMERNLMKRSLTERGLLKMA